VRAAAVVLALAAVAACSTGERGTIGSRSDPTTTTTSTSSGSGAKPVARDGADVRACDLVTLDVVGQVFGEQAAIAPATTSDLNQCTWVRRSAVDQPSAGGAGDLVSLTVVEPPAGPYVTAKEYWRDLRDVMLADGGKAVSGLGADAVSSGSRIDALKGAIVLETNASFEDGGDAAGASRAVMSAALHSL
jgi:hypothetical protein